MLCCLLREDDAQKFVNGINLDIKSRQVDQICITQGEESVTDHLKNLTKSDF